MSCFNFSLWEVIKKNCEKVDIFGVILPFYKGKKWAKTFTNRSGQAGGGCPPPHPTPPPPPQLQSFIILTTCNLSFIFPCWLGRKYPTPAPLGDCWPWKIIRSKCEISNFQSSRRVAVFSPQEVEGEMDPGNFCSIPQFMESAGVYRFLTQIPTCWITAKVVRWSSRTFFSNIIIFVVIM